MAPYTGGKLVASGGENDGETWEYSADGTLRCTKGKYSDSSAFVWNGTRRIILPLVLHAVTMPINQSLCTGMYLKQEWADERAYENDLGQGKWDKHKFEWTFLGGQVVRFQLSQHKRVWLVSLTVRTVMATGLFLLLARKQVVGEVVYQ